MLPDILPMRPYLREMIWGGRDLGVHYNKSLPPSGQVGESWEVSAYSGMESTVASGPLAGRTLGDIASTAGPELVGAAVHRRYGNEFPLLIKLLDARQDLSVQVHPDDEYASSHRLGRFGKMEAWVVLRSNGGRIACGLKAGVGRAEFQAAVSADRVEEAIEFRDARPGDVYYLPPGTVHALCKGVMVYEVQQSSDLTFRIYDYNRPGPDGNPRELHLDRALDVIAFEDTPQGPPRGAGLSEATPGGSTLVESPHFRLERFTGEGAVTDREAASSFAAVTLLEGSACVTAGEASHSFCTGDSFLVPAGREYRVRAAGSSPLEYLVATVP